MTVVVRKIKMAVSEKDKKFSSLMLEFLRHHYGLPDDMSLFEMIVEIKDSQDDSNEWERKSVLKVVITDDPEPCIVGILWVSGSKSGGLFGEAITISPWVILVDAGTSSADELKELMNSCKREGIDCSLVTVKSMNVSRYGGYVYLDTYKIIKTLSYGGNQAPPNFSVLDEGEDITDKIHLYL